MGLLDILNGMQNGPRGQTAPAAAGSGGMSPIVMALLGLVAYKAIKHLSPDQSNAMPANRGPSTVDSPSGGGLGGLLQGPLGGLLAGGAAGSVLSGGLGGLLKQFQQNGQSDIADSWVSTGPNKDISESDLAHSIGIEDIDQLSRHTGLSRDDLLAGLRRELPGVIDELTPNGRVPNADEFGRRV